MPILFQRYATPFITGLFLVSLISGVLLFFHIGPSGFRPMHEILSLVLILPFALHIWKNWRPMVVYFRRAPMIVALLVSAAGAGYFLIPTTGGTAGGPPPFVFATRMLNGTPAEIAAALDLPADAVTAALQAAGIPATPDQPVRAMATAAGKSDAEVYAVLNGLSG